MENETPGYYAVIPASVRYDSSLPQGAKLLYGEISALCNKKGYCWAGNGYFSELYETCSRTIIGWIKRLRDSGHITITFEYFPGSKKIKKRFISLSAPKAGTPDTRKAGENLVVKKFSPPGGLVVKKSSPPNGEKNCLENITSSNNTKAAAEEKPPEIEGETPESAAVSFEGKEAGNPPTPEIPAEDVKNLKDHFTSLDGSLCFDEGFYPEVLVFLKKHKIPLDYIIWFYRRCRKKNVRSMSNYFFASLLQSRYAALYKEESKPHEIRPASLMPCPVCAFEHNRTEAACPRCGFDINSRGDKNKIFLQKKLYEMDGELKKAYETETLLVIGSRSLDYREKSARLKTLKIKYGLEP